MFQFHQNSNKRLKITGLERTMFLNPNNWDLALMGDMIYFSKDESFDNNTPSNQRFNLRRADIDWANCNPTLPVPTTDMEAIESIVNTFLPIVYDDLL